MTTTRDVPMPATSPYVERIVRIFRDRVGDDTSAIVLLDFARAYADARCAKLQAELHACERNLSDMAALRDGWRKECEDAEAERDALAEKVKAQRDLIRELFAQYTKLYGVPVDQPPFIYHNPAWHELLSRAIECGAIEAAGGGDG